MELAEMIFEIVVYGKVADQTIRGTFQARPFKIQETETEGRQ